VRPVTGMKDILDAIVANKVTAWLEQQDGGPYVVALIAIALAIGAICRWRQSTTTPAVSRTTIAQTTGNFITHFHLGTELEATAPSLEESCRRRASHRGTALLDRVLTRTRPAAAVHLQSQANSPAAVRLEWHEEAEALHIDVTNTSSQTIPDCRLFLRDLRRYQPSVRRFVEVRVFHDTGPFVSVQLARSVASGDAVGSRQLFCGDPVTFQFLLYDSARLLFAGRTDDGSMLHRYVLDGGTWEATLMCVAAGKTRIERLCFQWDDVRYQPRPVHACEPL
jgi:hypothetical protein